MAISMLNKVTKIECIGDYRLHATFSDGTSGEYDFSEQVTETGPIIEPLRDPAYLRGYSLNSEAPTWPNGFDKCSDWLRQEIEMSGRLQPKP